MTYETALETARAATETFMSAQTAHRAGQITDAEYCAAFAANKAADKAFDVAFNAAQDVPEAVEAVAVEQTLGLFAA